LYYLLTLTYPRLLMLSGLYFSTISNIILDCPYYKIILAHIKIFFKY